MLPAPWSVRLGIPLVVVLVGALAAAIYAAAGRTAGETRERQQRQLRRAIAVLAGWLISTAATASSGLLQRTDLRPPPFVVLLGIVLGLGVWLGASRVGARIAAGTPLVVLVAFHVFRLPLELLIHQAALAGIAPIELSYAGYNFDIVTAIGALVIAVVYRRRPIPRLVAWAWSTIGLAALVVIAIVAVASSPLIHAFGEAPGHLNVWVAHFPYVWVPTVLVVAALAGHIVVIRKLRTPQQPL